MNCFDRVAMNCIAYMVSCNFTIHVTCLLTFTSHKYDELQMVIATQKLSCKVSYRKSSFHSDTHSISFHYYNKKVHDFENVLCIKKSLYLPTSFLCEHKIIVFLKTGIPSKTCVQNLDL
jgi:hypothetical protein